MRRFFCEALEASPIHTTQSVWHHMKHVLRLDIGTEVQLFNQSQSVTATIQSYEKDSAILHPTSDVQLHDQVLPHLHLYGALPKQQRLKTMIEKIAEVGLDEFTPLHAKRSAVTLPPERIETRLDKWQQSAIQAATQSKQTSITAFHAPLNTGDLPRVEPGSGYVLSTHGDSQDYVSCLQQSYDQNTPGQLALVIGPEGGFASNEIDTLTLKGYIPAHLNLPVLRIETAAIVSVALTKAFFNA